jgi:hypothetical protein
MSLVLVWYINHRSEQPANTVAITSPPSIANLSEVPDCPGTRVFPFEFDLE